MSKPKSKPSKADKARNHKLADLTEDISDAFDELAENTDAIFNLELSIEEQVADLMQWVNGGDGDAPLVDSMDLEELAYRRDEMREDEYHCASIIRQIRATTKNKKSWIDEYRPVFREFVKYNPVDITWDDFRRMIPKDIR